jgi:excisionase family DNA binding protein
MMLTVKEVAERLRVSRTCVYQLVERGKLACHRIGLGRGAIRIAIEDLAAYVEGCRVTRNAGTEMSPHAGRLKHLKQ